jgi:hypothetical protein
MPSLSSLALCKTPQGTYRRGRKNALKDSGFRKIAAKVRLKITQGRRVKGWWWLCIRQAHKAELRRKKRHLHFWLFQPSYSLMI